MLNVNLLIQIYFIGQNAANLNKQTASYVQFVQF